MRIYKNKKYYLFQASFARFQPAQLSDLQTSEQQLVEARQPSQLNYFRRQIQNRNAVSRNYKKNC